MIHFNLTTSDYRTNFGNRLGSTEIVQLPCDNLKLIFCVQLKFIVWSIAEIFILKYPPTHDLRSAAEKTTSADLMPWLNDI